MIAYENLYKEIIGLPDDKLETLLEFARFLKQGVTSGSANVQDVPRGRKIGFMADDFVSISSDFDECLEGLEDYV